MTHQMIWDAVHDFQGLLNCVDLNGDEELREMELCRDNGMDEELSVEWLEV